MEAFFPLPQHMNDFVCGIKIQGLVDVTRFDPVLSFLVIRRPDKLNWAINLFKLVPLFASHWIVAKCASVSTINGKEFSKSRPVTRAIFMASTIKNAAKDLDCAMKRPVIRSSVVAWESEEKIGEIEDLWTPLPAKNASAISLSRMGFLTL